MKRLYFYIIMTITLSANLFAQETYESARFANEDLNGTARYVGMGGAMEALGADLSTIASNPAGIGLFRKNTVNSSFGVVSQPGTSSFKDAKKTNLSFDQLGFVYSMRSGRRSYINVALNYHKSKNFDFILSVADRLNGASQGKLSYAKLYAGVFNISQTANGSYVGYDHNGNPSLSFNQIDYFYFNTTMKPDVNNNIFYDEANHYTLKRGNNGYIGEYDINVSGNEKDCFFWGLTIGLHDVHYKGNSVYREEYVDNSGHMEMNDIRKITGNGFDVKAGIILRPLSESPFRIGFYVHTPTWYDLTTKNYSIFNAGLNLRGGQTVNPSLQNNVKPFHEDMGEAYEFKFSTPWRFGMSLGHTIGNILAIGVTYEYADYGTCDNRVNDGGYYDVYWGEFHESSSSDEVMNEHTKQTLKGVSTIKVGLEYKPIPNFSIRAGYNYLSPMYKKDAFKNGTLMSYGSYYSSATDYTNWDSTKRITAGLGYAYKNWNIDLAYQYSNTDGYFSPFMSYFPNNVEEEQHLINSPGEVKVSNKRDQLLLTVGYRF